MARGVTQEQVNAAIEQLLLAGERPTIERVRATLGTGSPNTLTRMLDVWWQGLGQRLTVHRRSVALPDAPAAVVEAASLLWEVALAAGQAHAEAIVAPERAALAEALTAMETTIARERATAEAADRARDTAVAAAEGAQAALAISEQRNNDLRGEIAQQKEDLKAFKVRLEAELARSQHLELQADSARTAAAQEREALQRLLRQVEDRAYGEVDRTRQELKALRAELATQARDHARALRASEQQRRATETALATAQRALARRSGSATGARAIAGKSLPAPRRRPKSE